MKLKTLTAITGLALAATAQAGEDLSGKGVIAPPAPSCLWSWFAGGSGGYVSGDWDEEIYTLHVGAERKCAGNSCSHAFYLEVGYTESDFSESVSSNIQRPGYPGGDIYDDSNGSTNGSTNGGPYNGSFSTVSTYDISIDIIPITLNYKYECALSGNLNWYVGAGAGIALVDIDIEETTQAYDGPNGKGSKLGSASTASESDDDTAFYAHIFAGLVYNVSESFEVFGGARLIFMDDILDEQSPLDEEVHYEIGGRYNF